MRLHESRPTAGVAVRDAGEAIHHTTMHAGRESTKHGHVGMEVELLPVVEVQS
jgi:hypothetical protein